MNKDLTSVIFISIPNQINLAKAGLGLDDELSKSDTAVMVSSSMFRKIGCISENNDKPVIALRLCSRIRIESFYGVKQTRY